MKTILRLSSLMLICGCALMLFGATADLHAQSAALEVSGNTGQDKEYYIGDLVTTNFNVKLDGIPQEGEVLNINTNGIINLRINEVPANRTGTGMSNALGRVTVEGEISVESGAYIEAEWVRKDQSAKADFRGKEAGVNPVLIVVNPPVPKGNGPDLKDRLKAGDTFTQTITIENRGGRFDSLPLSAWQMDVVYNPEILQVVNVMHGDFLKKGGVNTHDFEKLPRMPGKVSVSQSRPGLDSNENAIPSPDGIALKPTAPDDTGTLLTIEFKVLAFAEEVLGIHNIQLQSDYMEDGKMQYERLSYSILVRDVFVATQRMQYEKEDVNQDEMVNVLDLMAVANMIGHHSVPPPNNPPGRVGSRADVNGDGFINVLDLVAIYTSNLWAKSAPATEDETSRRYANEEAALGAPSVNGNVDPATIRSWIDLARVEDDGSAVFDAGIAKLEALLASKIPSETKLLLNYPNPFNPETWIPYQLAKATEVTLTIHAMNGSLIRTLALGHQAAGVYKSKSQAAYWDGRNELGEQAASGLYFYTLTAGDFSATGKMLVRK